MTNERVTANGFRPDATGFQVPSAPDHRRTLFGVGCAICMPASPSAARAADGGPAVGSRLERPPSEIAKGTWAQAKAAYAAGSRAWQDENTTQPANAES